MTIPSDLLRYRQTQTSQLANMIDPEVGAGPAIAVIMTNRLIALLVPAVLSAGCGADGGELGQGGVTGGCDSFASNCSLTGIDHPIAVGASLPVTVDSSMFAAAGPELNLSSGRPAVLSVVGQTLTANEEGMAPLFIGIANQDAVLDFIHVRAARADNLKFAIALADGTDLKELSTSIELVPNEYIWAEVSPFKGIAPLVGRMPLVWSSNSPAVTVLKTGASSRVRVIARSPGSAVITATALGLTATFTIEVL